MYVVAIIALYIFGIGGLSKKALIAEARAKMLARSNIIGGSKAVINETVEVSYSFFPFVRFYNVTVSAHIIEFTDWSTYQNKPNIMLENN